jgi:hypothetical protein
MHSLIVLQFTSMWHAVQRLIRSVSECVLQLVVSSSPPVCTVETHSENQKVQNRPLPVLRVLPNLYVLSNYINMIILLGLCLASCLRVLHAACMQVPASHMGRLHALRRRMRSRICIRRPATPVFFLFDRLRGQVVRVPGYRSRGPDSILGNTKFSEM